MNNSLPLLMAISGAIALLAGPVLKERWGGSASNATSKIGGILIIPAIYEFLSKVLCDIRDSRAAKSISLFTLTSTLVAVISTLFPLAASFLHNHTKFQFAVPALLSGGFYSYLSFRWLGILFWALIPLYSYQECYDDRYILGFILGNPIVVKNLHD